ncbi:CPBP family intramembrane metalloprotease [Parasphingopyxis algicola]|uniref:CPBP family intramembrane glutamic endopeptidase n=1 Tax=Parasphingopyxis algicola TaxID=2026624 RepID=UPI0015A1661D|nr:CPBP family intramembrane glutamic endopeptidase [Parasphingopyxis algicola]QLC23718.1 CPBP family intramembrane metalloprotease [Parasphingopyxis algicola]
MDVGTVDYWMSALLWNAVFLAGGGVAALAARGQVNWRWFLLAWLLFNLNVALVLNFFGLNGLLYGLAGDPDVSFNWAGKIAALAVSIAILAFGIVDREAAGVTFRQNAGARIGWIAFAILCAIDVLIAVIIETPPPDIEAIAYQLTMPSLEEEIFYRGILLFCLVKAFGDGPRVAFANIGFAAIMSVILFGAVHSLFWAGGAPVFVLEIFLITGSIGLILTWLRLNTGSILASMLLHSVINTVWRMI